MKKVLLSALLLTAVIGTVATTNASTTPVATKDKGSVSVNLSASREIAPNMAEVTFSIETSDKSLQKASADNKVAADAVYSSLKALINPEKGDYIKTANFRANPEYVYVKEKRVFDKYVVSNEIVVNTKNINLVAKLVDTAIAKGATNVNNLDFTVSNYDSQCNEMLAETTKRVYSQANAIAGSIGSKVIGVKNINASCSSQNTLQPMYARLNMAKGAETQDSATPIDAGKVKIRANVNADFFVN